MNDQPSISDRLARLEEKQVGHEQICAVRYGQILEKTKEMSEKSEKNQQRMIGAIVLLFLLELGKATFPALFEALSKALMHTL